MLTALTIAASFCVVAGLAVMIFVWREDFARAHSNSAQRAWAKKHGIRRGFYPPMREPLGLVLLAVSVFSLVGMAALVLAEVPEFGALSLGVGVGANFWNSHRNLDWLYSHDEYRALARDAVSK